MSTWWFEKLAVTFVDVQILDFDAFKFQKCGAYLPFQLRYLDLESTSIQSMFEPRSHDDDYDDADDDHDKMVMTAINASSPCRQRLPPSRERVKPLLEYPQAAIKPHQKNALSLDDLRVLKSLASRFRGSYFVEPEYPQSQTRFLVHGTMNRPAFQEPTHLLAHVHRCCFHSD